MSFQYKLLLLIIGLVVSLPLVTFASDEDPGHAPLKKKKSQEDSLSIYEQENKIIEEIIIPDFHKTKSVIVHPVLSTPTKKLAKRDTEKEVMATEEDNSAMSFNFIYYIIDTFKFTDPLE